MVVTKSEVFLEVLLARPAEEPPDLQDRPVPQRLEHLVAGLEEEGGREEGGRQGAGEGAGQGGGGQGRARQAGMGGGRKAGKQRKCSDHCL
eukprot:SAG22_NODE_1820_length_3514_cov_2.304539_6_plen_91_part_00